MDLCPSAMFGIILYAVILPRIWNLLPYKLRCLTELTAFKNGLKTHLFFLAFEGIY